MNRYVRAFSGVSQAARTPISRPVLARARHVMFVLAAVLALIWLMGRAGLLDIGDRYLRSLYYALSETDTVSDEVVFVAMDEHTGAAWGPPPWSWQRYEDMLAAIIEAQPRAVALLEPGPRVAPGEPPNFGPLVANAIGAGRIVLPPPNAGLGQPSLVLDEAHGIEAVELGLADDSLRPGVTRMLIRAATLPMPPGDTLWVHYLGGPRSLPTVPAHRIATGEIPGNTFEDRIVVIGLRGERFAPQVPTPVGALSPAEVHAHAIRGLARDSVWLPLPTWARWLLSASLGLFSLLLVPRLGLRRSMGLVGAVMLLLVVLDYTMFALGLLRVGATAPMLVVGFAAGASWLGERRMVLVELELMSRWSARRLALENTDQERAGFVERWDRFAHTSRTFAKFESTLLGELSENNWHLDFALALGVEPERIQEMRRDVRREPYKSAIMMHRPIWSDRFMDTELQQKSLLVPLSSFNRVLGLWVVNFRKGVEVPNDTLDMLKLFAEQLALSMERQRIQRLRHERAAVRESLLLRPLQEVRNTLQFLAHEQSSMSKTFESLPVGILVATLWGEVSYINATMRHFLGALHVDNAKATSLPDLLAAVTGSSDEEIQATVSRLFAGRPYVELNCKTDSALGSSFQLTLSALSETPLLTELDAAPEAAIEDPGSADAAQGKAADEQPAPSAAPRGDAAALSHVVLTVTRRARADATRSDADADADNHAVRHSAISGR